ncbi:MAG: diaminopimelate decarboxylase [Oscillospiraceae bacterium]
MLISDCLSVNAHGNLAISGADTVALAQEFGTPLYVMSEEEVRRSCKSFVESMNCCYGSNSLVVYASKALNCKEMCRIVLSEGLGLDVVSGGELYTAMSVNFPTEKILFHGNNKTAAELQYALECGVGTIVVDNITELELLNSLAETMGISQEIMLRVKPGIEAHTHRYIMTGSIDSKFGFALENNEAMEAAKAVQLYKNLNLKGIHCHIGSQIFEIEPFCETARIMINFIKEIKDSLGIEIDKLNLGGGFGIRYIPEQEPKEPIDFLRRVSQVVNAEVERLGLKRPMMIIEPGRAISAPAGITLYTVGSVKKIKDIRTYVSVDGGLPDNPRYALYGSEYTAVIANKADRAADMKVTIAGKCCESGDLLQENTYIQQAAVGDVLAVLATGAYNYSMASNYNRIARPEMIMIRESKPRVIIRRESYEDLIRNDV